MELDLHRATAILERTPRVLRAWLSGLDEAWTHANYGPSTWSAYQVVGHLIIGERTDWIPRARIILQHGPARPFDPFPHTAAIGPESGRSLDDLLDEFAALRHDSLAELAAMNLTPAKLALRGTHPALGQVTLSQLIATWTVHDIHHTAQIAKAMAYQWRDQVGPWRAYLNILPPDAA
jgi:uncharacterized damage-inducible protein DinB